MAIHRVRNPSGFDSLLSEAGERIKSMGDGDLLTLANLARVRNPGVVVAFLISTRDRLDDELVELRGVLRREWSY
jgi:hypothetical protein